jgi:hypothetical protein
MFIASIPNQVIWHMVNVSSVPSKVHVHHTAEILKMSQSIYVFVVKVKPYQFNIDPIR